MASFSASAISGLYPSSLSALSNLTLINFFNLSNELVSVPTAVFIASSAIVSGIKFS